MTIYKLTLKYSSFLFTNDVSLVKNVEQSVDIDKLTAKDITIINAYIASGAIVSDKGQLPLKEAVETPVVEEVKEDEVEVIKEEVKIEKEVVASILDGESDSKKKPTAKKTPSKKA